MKLYVVGLGPGDQGDMTVRALGALAQSELIVGYEGYINLIRDRFPGKEFFSTPMRQEVERCRKALEEAAGGKTVSMVCSGDPGIYGMAGLIYQLAMDYPPVAIQVIPGITAACSGAALLGAPLANDFAVISLSDQLTPWETIERRLRSAAAGDFCLALYNPASHSRPDTLRRACDILLETYPPNTPAGVVQNVGRDGESYLVLSLEQLRELPADLLTTVFVGNSTTRTVAGRLVTPRGYRQA